MVFGFLMNILEHFTILAHIPKALNVWPLFGGGLMVLHVGPFYWHMVLGFLMHILEEHAQNPYHSMPKKSQHAQKPLSQHAQKNEVMLTH